MTKKKLTPSEEMSPELVLVAKDLCSRPLHEIAMFCTLCAQLLLGRSRNLSEGDQDRRDRFRFHARSLEVLADAVTKTAAMPPE